MKNRYRFSGDMLRHAPATSRIIFIMLITGIFILMNPIHSFSQTLPAGFSQVQVATGITNPTIMAASPDGRIFIAQQNGLLLVFKNGALLPTPFVSLNVNTAGERGLIGIAFDPNFATNQFVYLFYTVSSGAYNRISRFTANGDVAVAGSEVILLNLDPLSSATNHNGGTMVFGPDGKLYVGVGENANSANSQNLDTYHGKILRLNSDCTPAPGNPFASGATVQRRSIWAYGLRNPYTLTFQPGTGKLHVNDVGETTWEEINNCTTGGGNYGWPSAEGMSTNPAYVNPIYTYMHGSALGQGCAITGGTFFNPTTTNYPSTYTGNYFFIDYCNNWIDRLTISGSTVTRTNFASNIAGLPVGIITAPDGNLYFLSRANESLNRISYSGSSAPVITTQPQSISVSQGNQATFSVTATGTAPLSYQWRKNGANISGATSSSYTIASVTTTHAGTYSVVVSNSSGSATSNNATLTVTTANTPPVATIVTPAAGVTYTAGTSISFSGTGTDNENGTLAASAFVWFVTFHHDTHTHPGPSAPDGVTSGSLSIPNTGETAANVFYRLYLVVTDLNGAKDTAYTDILPKTSTITINTNPQGLTVTLDGQPFTAPYTVTSVEGMLRSIGTNSPQTINTTTYTFSSWAHGGAQTQNITTPVSNTNYTANFSGSLRPADNPTGTVGGLNYSYYNGSWTVLPNFTSLTPNATGTVTNFSLTPRTQNDQFGFRYTGYVNVPTSGVYTFYTSSDDGSKLYIGSTTVVNNDGLHATQERSGQIGLAAGMHALTVEFFEQGSNEVLTVSYAGPGITKQVIPNSALFRPGSSQTVTVNPVADSYVRAGTYTNTNYGTSSLLYSRKSTGNGLYESYLRFNISSFTSSVGSAKLRLYARVSNTNTASIPVEVLYVSNNTWSETSINYTNKPAPSGAVLATVTVTGTNSVYYEWNITSQVASLKAAGINTISLLVRNVNTTSNSRVIFNSREAASNKPQLVISTNTLREADPDAGIITLNTQIEPELRIYPQPARDNITIEIPDGYTTGILSITDMKGAEVMKLKIENNSMLQIPIDEYPTGIYVVKMNTGEAVLHKKILIGR